MANIIRFDSYEVDLAAGQLRKNGVRISVRDQSVQVLGFLLEHPGEVISRDELRHRIWRDQVFVEFDNSLNTAVARLREALCDSAQNPRFIETLPKRGYRFIADLLPSTIEAPPKRSRLLVLPFLNLCGDAAREYFSDAVTDEIITALATFAPEHLAVIARTTAMHYKGSRKDVARIARELNIDYVVEGGILRVDDTVVINVQLIDARDQSHIFADKYEAELSQIFALNHHIAQDIAGHLPCLWNKLSPTGAGHQSGKPTEDMVAYNDYIQGRHLMWKWTSESIARARQFFEAAIARDPSFALPYDALAELCWYSGFWGFERPREMDLIGRGFALRAIELDDTLAETHALLWSFFPKGNCWNWDEGYKHIARAKLLNPNSPNVKLRYAMTLLVLGRLEEALSELQHALELDPLSLQIRGWYSEVLYFSRRYDEAIQHAQETVELVPEHFLSHMVLGQVCLGIFRFDEGISELRRAAELSGRLPLLLGWLGLALGLSGQSTEARALLATLTATANQRYVPPTSFAWLHLALGELDEAFEWLDRAADEGDRMIAPLNSYPFLEFLRSDPRFRSLQRKLNLSS